ncbi:MAG TPA: hypothetical protein VE890_17280 [Thermoguttaceae bacterium]|nr:hypothetical protein [Thermoguttaceae bacterium]
MAVSKKVRVWFQEEHGFPLSEAFDIMQPQRKPEGKLKSKSAAMLRMIGRGYPFFGKAISVDRIDSENARLAEELARTTSIANKKSASLS